MRFICITSPECGPNPAEDTEDALHEEVRLDDAAVREMHQCVEVTDIVAVELEAGAVFGTGGQEVLDVRKRILEDAIERAS